MFRAPPFFQEQQVDVDADERTIKRAYAKALKKIDQENDLVGFQALRESYERAIAWAQASAWRAAQMAETEEEEYEEEELRDAQAEDAVEQPESQLTIASNLDVQNQAEILVSANEDLQHAEDVKDGGAKGGEKTAEPELDALDFSLIDSEVKADAKIEVKPDTHSESDAHSGSDRKLDIQIDTVVLPPVQTQAVPLFVQQEELPPLEIDTIVDVHRSEDPANPIAEGQPDLKQEQKREQREEQPPKQEEVRQHSQEEPLNSSFGFKLNAGNQMPDTSFTPIDLARTLVLEFLEKVSAQEATTGSAEHLLNAVMDDERLINVEVRDLFEVMLVEHLQHGWQPGNGDLFGAAAKVFGWQKIKAGCLVWRVRITTSIMLCQS